MHSFKDQDDRTWDIVLNPPNIKRVRSRLQVDLQNTDDYKKLADLCLLADVLYVLCEKQCREREVTDQQFGEALSGPTMHEAAVALQEEWADFFQTPATKEAAKAALAKVRETEPHVARMMQERIANLDPQKLAEQLMNSRSNAAAFWDSIQTPTPEASAN